MAAQYKAFLDSPSPDLLADDASLFYITTTTEIREAAAILKHLQVQHRQVEKKEEKILNTVESGDGCVFVETAVTFQFKLGGGALLPGIDENLLDEKVVVLPMMHVVRFDEKQKIRSIRMHWDQACLLKQVEVIGKSGRNWPIRDAKAQLDLINKTLKPGGGGGDAGGMNGSAPLPLKTPRDGAHDAPHRRGESVSAIRGETVNLSLFAPRDPNEDAVSRTYNGPRHAPRASARPAPRDLVDIVGEEDPTTAKARSPSPSKADGTILKGGAGRFHIGNRLFSEDENERPKSPERKKTYAQKYDHFTFGDGEDAPVLSRPTSGKSSKQGGPTFDFADFSTPPKIEGKTRPDYDRKWGAGVDEDDPPSPAKRPVVHAPRPDAETHFQFTDDSPGPVKTKSLQREKGMGLYQDPLYVDERTTMKSGLHVNNTRRGDDFGAHYTLTDDLTPQEKKIYKTAGDGMGGRRANERQWGIGDESDPDVSKESNVRSSARGRVRQADGGARES